MHYTKLAKISTDSGHLTFLTHGGETFCTHFNILISHLSRRLSWLMPYTPSDISDLLHAKWDERTSAPTVIPSKKESQLKTTGRALVS